VRYEHTQGLEVAESNVSRILGTLQPHQKGILEDLIFRCYVDAGVTDPSVVKDSLSRRQPEGFEKSLEQVKAEIDKIVRQKPVRPSPSLALAFGTAQRQRYSYPVNQDRSVPSSPPTDSTSDTPILNGFRTLGSLSSAEIEEEKEKHLKQINDEYEGLQRLNDQVSSIQSRKEDLRQREEDLRQREEKLREESDALKKDKRRLEDDEASFLSDVEILKKRRFNASG